MAKRQRTSTWAAWTAKRCKPCVCEQCGEIYTPKAPDRTRFCGRACYYAWKASRKAATAPEGDRSCTECGSRVVGRRDRVVCSAECSKRRNLKLAKRFYVENRIDKPRACTSCGSVFVPRVGQGNHSVCSEVCRKRNNRVAESRVKARRRAKKHSAFVENVRFDVVAKRDHWRCHLCHKAVNRKAIVPHPKAPTMDHVIPLARGGEHSYRNLRLAHFGCNALKRDLPIGQPRLIG